MKRAGSYRISMMMRLKISRLTLASSALLHSIGLEASPRNAKNSADVIVYGSTPCGFCTAIGAGREGASVILLEPTAHVSGMNTGGGLSFSDSNQMYRDKLIGLFHEWHLRIHKDYESRGAKLPYDVNVKDQSKWSYEPHIATKITDEMLAEAEVTVLTGRYLQSPEPLKGIVLDDSQAELAGEKVSEIGTVQLAANQESVITDGTKGIEGFVTLDAIQLNPAASK